MATAKVQGEKSPSSDQQRADLEKQALAGPGVVDLMLLYEAAEKVYSSATSSTIHEPKIWFTTSTQ